jgi:hypothetical protein
MADPTDGNDCGKAPPKPDAAAGDEKLTEQQAADRYDQNLDAGAWDHDAAAAGTDPITEAYRELLRRKYTRVAEGRKKGENEERT